MRELGCCASRALGGSTSRGKSRIRWTNLYPRVPGDAAGEHRNSAGQYGDTSRWHRYTTSRNAADHSRFHITERSSEHNGAGLEFTDGPDTG